MPAAHTLEVMGALEPGDAIVTNDPYTSNAMATHLPDLHVIRPYFHGPRLVGYGWGFIHYMDVGGRFPGSMSPHTADIFQEGFRIPPMKLMRKGVLNQDFIHLFKANCRLPETNMADLKAMLGALEVGGQRVRDAIDRYGVETFIASQGALKDYAADKAREGAPPAPGRDLRFLGTISTTTSSPRSPFECACGPPWTTAGGTST